MPETRARATSEVVTDVNTALATKANIVQIQNAQYGPTFTFTLADSTQTVTADNPGVSTYTVPPQASVAWANYTVLRILNLGAGVLTIAAGAGVTLTGRVTLTQYESATLTRTASDAWTINGNTITPGMVLITPTSVVGATLSGGQISFSASTGVSVNGCFSATYDNYLMFFKHSDAASAGQLNIRMRLAGTDATTATYFSQYIFGGVTTVSANQATSGTSARFASGNAGVAPVTIEMYSPFIAEATTFQARSIYTATSNPNIFVEAGSHNVATAYDGISFLPSATTMTGTLRIYGLRNA